MTWKAYEMDARREGRIEGRREGRIEGRIEGRAEGIIRSGRRHSLSDVNDRGGYSGGNRM